MSLFENDDRLLKVRIHQSFRFQKVAVKAKYITPETEAGSKFQQGVNIKLLYFNGLGTQLWQLEAKLDNGAALTKQPY